MAIVLCKNLSIGYDNKIIVKDLNIDIDEKDYLVIVGENGAGKSTLMKTFLGLQKPISGEIVFDKTLKRNDLGYLPQKTNFKNDFPTSVLEVVLSGFSSKKGFRPFYNKKDKKEAISNLNKIGLTSFEKKPYSELSGGQQQRALLARALCASSKVLLLDEPVSGLDPIATKEMYETIKKLNDEGLTIIMISHDSISAFDYANKVLHIGKNIFYGPKEEYLKSDFYSKFVKEGGNNG